MSDKSRQVKRCLFPLAMIHSWRKSSVNNTWTRNLPRDASNKYTFIYTFIRDACQFYCSYFRWHSDIKEYRKKKEKIAETSFSYIIHAGRKCLFAYVLLNKMYSFSWRYYVKALICENFIKYSKLSQSLWNPINSQINS